MEHFHRAMRRRTGLLMDGDQPVGGVWNLDKENRQPPRKGALSPPMRFTPDDITREMIDLVAHRFADHFGTLEELHLPVTATQARRALSHFIRTAPPHFGRWQDAMVQPEPLLFHSWLSPALNCGLLTAAKVCKAAEAYAAGDVPLNSAEGLIRQILGWREYMRGISWLEMPGLGTANALDHHRPLPEFYGMGDPDMLCLREPIRATHDLAYAHHIQRLMMLGNFALLAGVTPQAISNWFLVVYVDAFEWVELPNVAGMSQFADGGRLGSKPYVSSGASIDRMSDYCSACAYHVTQKIGEDACPFNALYRDLLARHERRLRPNRRMGPVYSNWDRMADEEKRALRSSAHAFLGTLEPAATGWAKYSTAIGIHSLASAVFCLHIQRDGVSMGVWIIAYIAAGITMLGLDAIWLSFAASRLYRPRLGDMLLDNFRVAPAIFFYLIYIAGILVLAVQPAAATGRPTAAPMRGAALGFVAYATYDLTNQATLRGWSGAVTAADLCWGTFLTAIAATAGLLAWQKVTQFLG